MTERELLPGEYAILGLLLEGPMHGYEMARHFEGHELTTACPIEQSSLYTYLRNVEGRELVRWEETRVGARPPRKMYSLTDAGERSVRAWLDSPVMRLREVRLDFLLKLYFLHRLDPDAERELLQVQIDVCRDYLGTLESQPDSTPFLRLVHGSKRSAALATLNWLRSYADDLEKERRHS
ncbi:MAG TPA: PadR family transcriptional regulator [Tepidiformaceae bacterium]|nr:PadR family transcriptional regulator [Tepidiformaceae bacterium]